MVPGHTVDPALEIFYAVFMEFGYGFEKDLLNAVLCLFLILQIFHAHTKKNEGIALQENSKPLVVVVSIKILEDTGISDMLVWILIHRPESKDFSQAKMFEQTEFHNLQS